MTGSCLCGAVRYRIEGAPSRMLYCHCEHCRRASGSSFATNVLVDRDRFRLTSGEEVLGAYESRPGKIRHFCTRCGSPIYNRLTDGTGPCIVRAGTLDGDPGLRPSVHIWVSSKAPWVELDDGTPKHGRGFDSPIVDP